MDKDAARDRLLQERERLADLRSATESSVADNDSRQSSLGELSSVDQHPADQGTETLEREQSLSLLEQLDGQIADVDRALAGIDSGSYGICEACGAPIDEARLEARPAARYCIKDQSRLEREIRSSAS